ncbi:hypothetical protein Tco_0258435, partial [Tanacetum coccineum]
MSFPASTKKSPLRPIYPIPNTTLLHAPQPPSPSQPRTTKRVRLLVVNTHEGAFVLGSQSQQGSVWGVRLAMVFHHRM